MDIYTYIASCVYIYIYFCIIYIYIFILIDIMYIYDISIPLQLFRLKWALLTILILMCVFFLICVGRERLGMVPVGFMLPP